jgi:hypothetical protein
MPKKGKGVFIIEDDGDVSETKTCNFLNFKFIIVESKTLAHPQKIRIVHTQSTFMLCSY